jgi:hypothetical protein
MDEATFWSVIDEARDDFEDTEGDLQDLVDLIQARLESMEDEQVAGFQQQMAVQYCKTLDWNLLGAAFIILGENCQNEDLHGFRGWLIAQGSEFFNRTVKDPDSLADEDLTPSDLFLPEIVDLAAEVYQSSTGEMPPPDPNFEPPDEPSGTPFEADDLPERLPRLCEEYVFVVPEEEEEEAEATD